jgi:hypothetical protein
LGFLGIPSVQEGLTHTGYLVDCRIG